MLKKRIQYGLITILFALTSQVIHAQKAFRLSEVKLLEGPFLNAQQVDLQYILTLDPDQLLAPFLKEAGITPLKDNYGDWESVGLGGQTAGHYLTALSLMVVSADCGECLQRLDYMINWIDSCQQKNGNGYVGGTPDGQKMWLDIEQGNIHADGFSINNKWVPLYNLHKLYAGLRDAYLYTNNPKALDILVKLSDWFYNLSQHLSDEQMQEILQCEHGGINEIFVQVANITGDKKYLDLAQKVSHRAILDPLIAHKNDLTGKHANTQIPKVIGFKSIADATHNVAWDSAAAFFWKTVTNEWTLSIGGNSVNEHFHPISDFASVMESSTGPETCNTYNMLRLTRLLYLSDPDAKYMDYYEKAVFNHILSSQHPTKGGFVYFTPMRPRHYRVYSQSQNNFWCCVGTGMENHAKYGEMIYTHDDNSLYVNLFIASELNWKEKGLQIIQETRFPYQDFTTIKFQETSASVIPLKVRKPSWANEKEIQVRINGKRTEKFEIDNNYITLHKKWKSGDEVQLKLPMHIGIEYLPDSSAWASIKYGPIILAAKSDTLNQDGLFASEGRGSHVAKGALYDMSVAPFIISEEKDFSSKIKLLNKEHLTFQMPDLIYQKSQKDLVLQPFFEIHEARYQIYFPAYTAKEFEEKKQAIIEVEKQKLALEKRTIDQVATGEQQPEGDHNLQGENTRSGIHNQKHWRDATGWFSYDLNDKEKEASVLQITYFGPDSGRTFDILLNDIKLETITLKGDKGGSFVTEDYSIPVNLRNSHKGIITVKFVATPNSKAGGIYYVRLLKD